jgi:hypothetical protein
MFRAIVGALVLAVAATTASGDSWMAPVAERFVDSDGDYHVIVSPSGKFRYARRGTGNDPVTAMRDEEEGGWRSDRTIPLRKGDTLIAEGELPHRPMDVVISRRGSGFVAIDQYAMLGYGDTIVVVDSTGRITHRKKLEELFPKEGIGVFTHTVSSIWWRVGAWMDDEKESRRTSRAAWRTALPRPATWRWSSSGTRRSPESSRRCRTCSPMRTPRAARGCAWR